MSSRILLVEDDSMQSHILANYLAAQDYHVEVAANGLAAINMAKAGWYDLVIMDYHLPELDGMSTARLIRAITQYGCSPAIVGITASPASLEVAEREHDHVFAAIIAKPWTRAVMRETVDFVLNQQRVARGDGRSWPHWRSHQFPLAETSAIERPHVLIADDDEVLLSTYKSILTKKGCHVDTVTNGIKAFEMIDSHGYDVAVLDYGLPDIDGVTVAGIVHDVVSRPRRPRMIALSATPEAVRARECGSVSAFDWVIGKGEQLQTMLVAIENSIRYRFTEKARGMITASSIAAQLGVTGVA